MTMLKLAAFAALLIPTLLVADEDPNHIAFGSRPISEEAAAEDSLEAAGFIFDHYPPVYFSTSHHWLAAVAILDNDKYTLELEDGSVWKVNSYDGSKALHWRSNDPLIITQNTRWFSNSNYRIINKSNGSSLEANPYLGPIKDGPYTRYIVSIDFDRREIQLSDNTHWEISYLDTIAFRNHWALSDAVIIGSNSGWDSSCEAILINVNVNHFVRAKQF